MPLVTALLLFLISLGWTNPPRVVDGVLDARSWNFEDGTLRLDGNWHLHKGLRLNPTDTSQEVLTPVPGWWKSSLDRDPQEDIATYRLHLVLPAAGAAGGPASDLPPPTGAEGSDPPCPGPGAVAGYAG